MQYTITARCSRQVCWLPLSGITLRTEDAFGQEESRSLLELADSIQRHGLLNPITVQPLGEGRYGIVSGNRRYLACRLAGFTHIDAIILPATGPDLTQARLLAQLTGGQLHYFEEAEICRRLVEEGMSREQLARCWGKTPFQIARKLRLTELDGELQNYLVEHDLAEGYARALSKLPDRHGRMCIARQAVAQKLYVRDVEVLVASAINRLPVPPPTGGKMISLMRDHRLYLNAIQSIISQMQEAGIEAETHQTRFGEYVEVSVRIPVRRRRASRDKGEMMLPGSQPEA